MVIDVDRMVKKNLIYILMDTLRTPLSERREGWDTVGKVECSVNQTSFKYFRIVTIYRCTGTEEIGRVRHLLENFI